MQLLQSDASVGGWLEIILEVGNEESIVVFSYCQIVEPGQFASCVKKKGRI
jgi:hypothetical protein